MTLRRPSLKESRELSFEFMACVFRLHNELGRFFDEKVYKRELARRFGNVQIEAPIDVSFDGYTKKYYVDLVLQSAVLVELKAMQTLAPRHRAQLLNYLHLCDLPHGKLVNLRPATVKHEFVNSNSRPTDRRVHRVDRSRWESLSPSDQRWADWILAALEDWGSGLDSRLYEDALTHAVGRGVEVLRKVQIIVQGTIVGDQLVRYCGPEWIFKMTTFQKERATFESHARRFLEHTRLRAIQWINIGRNAVTLVTITK